MLGFTYIKYMLICLLICILFAHKEDIQINRRSNCFSLRQQWPPGPIALI